MKTTVSVTEAQKQLPRILRQEQVIAVMRRDVIAGFVVPRERFESLLETVETLANPETMKAIKKFQAGRMKFRAWKDVKRELQSRE